METTPRLLRLSMAGRLNPLLLKEGRPPKHECKRNLTKKRRYDTIFVRFVADPFSLFNLNFFKKYLNSPVLKKMVGGATSGGEQAFF